MPGLPLPQPPAQTPGCDYACPGPAGHIFRQRPRTGLSPEEKLAAEKDLALYFTEDFSCPFCYVRCGSFKISEEYQVVNVILKYDAEQTEPMALEQVYSDRDSEDEVDDDIADFEDRRMLDDFVDVTKDEKLIMHMWNSFVRKQSSPW
nr:unnamed protein product [Digitaria exilis]